MGIAITHAQVLRITAGKGWVEIEHGNSQCLPLRPDKIVLSVVGVVRQPFQNGPHDKERGFITSLDANITPIVTAGDKQVRQAHGVRPEAAAVIANDLVSQQQTHVTTAEGRPLCGAVPTGRSISTEEALHLYARQQLGRDMDCSTCYDRVRCGNTR